MHTRYFNLLLFTFAVSVLAPMAYAETTIIATTGMIGDIASEVVGDRARVETLIGAGVDPHLYSPTRSDIGRLVSADIVFYNGLLLEGKMTDALIRVAGSGKKVIPVTERLDKKFLLAPDDFEGHYDPHVWMDPRAWKQALFVIRDTLVAHDPENASYYKARATKYITKLDELDKYVEGCISRIPKDSRVLVTAHDAFNYFGKRYGLQVLGIQGISTESEAGLRDIESIVSTIVSKGIRAVFTESTVSTRNVQALIEGARAQQHTVTIGGALYSDAMGKPDTYEGTYMGMIDHNATVIARALGAPGIPSKGMNGRLTGGHK